MDDEREVIISGKISDLQAMLEAAIKQLNEGSDAALYIEGNGGPGIALRFSVESGADWDTGPLVDFE